MSHEKMLLIEGIVIGLALIGFKAGILISTKKKLEEPKKKPEKEEKGA